jgi:hypothetical protein
MVTGRGEVREAVLDPRGSPDIQFPGYIHHHDATLVLLADREL